MAQPLAGLSFCLQAIPGVERPAGVCRELVQELASLMADLRSPVLAGMDGLEAVEELAQARGVSYRGPQPRPRVGGVAGLFLFRLVQEAIQNALRHARAQTVEVHLEAEGHDTEHLGLDEDLDAGSHGRAASPGLPGSRSPALVQDPASSSLPHGVERTIRGDGRQT